MARVILVAEENCASFVIAGCRDAFTMANFVWAFMGHEEPVFDMQTVTLDGQSVRASGGIVVQSQGSLESSGESDVVLLPAFLPPFDLENERIGKLCDSLCSRYDRGEYLVSACTGTFFLAKTGLLDGRDATTNWLFERLFRQMYPRVNLRTDRILVEDRRLVTTGAATAFFNMCLYFVERYGNGELAAQCSRCMLIDPERTSQAPYMLHDFCQDHQDEGVRSAQRLMQERYSEDLSVEEIARRVGISQRHFKRRFKQATGDTPLSYLQHLRIESAKKMLETTRESVSEIIGRIGYEDINSFRRLFRRVTGMSPRDYRNKYFRFARPIG